MSVKELAPQTFDPFDFDQFEAQPVQPYLATVTPIDTRLGARRALHEAEPSMAQTTETDYKPRRAYEGVIDASKAEAREAMGHAREAGAIIISAVGDSLSTRYNDTKASFNNTYDSLKKGGQSKLNSFKSFLKEKAAVAIYHSTRIDRAAFNIATKVDRTVFGAGTKLDRAAIEASTKIDRTAFRVGAKIGRIGLGVDAIVAGAVVESVSKRKAAAVKLGSAAIGGLKAGGTFLKDGAYDKIGDGLDVVEATMNKVSAARAARIRAKQVAKARQTRMVATRQALKHSKKMATFDAKRTAAQERLAQLS